jgi:hypothetical protein
LIFHCRCQVLELCHTFKGSIILLHYVVTSSCILLVKQTCRSIRLLAAYKASVLVTVMFPPNKLTSSEANVSHPVSVPPGWKTTDTDVPIHYWPFYCLFLYLALYILIFYICWRIIYFMECVIL